MASDDCTYTAAEVERVVRTAGELARTRRRKVTSVGQAAPVTRVIHISELQKNFNWEDGNPSTDTLRSAKVEDNPIVRRFSESQVNLDFRGLQELSQGLQDAGTGLRPASPQAVDGIALRLVVAFNIAGLLLALGLGTSDGGPGVTCT